MLTKNKEDYIKTIFSMNERKEKLSNKDLASILNVTAASSSEMIKKLMKSGHVLRDDLLGFTLSDHAFEEGKQLIKKHRLWEFFLVKELGLLWDEVHDDAELLEHVTSDHLYDKLNEYLSKPKYCPHGSIIYGNGASLNYNLVPMSDLKSGDKATLMRVKDRSDLLAYVENLGFHLGSTFELITVDPYEGPFHIKIDNEELIVSYKAVQDLYVEPII